MTAKKLYLRSFGCQMNDYDSARIVDLMAKNGYERVAAPEEADLVVIVTCSIREKAQEKDASAKSRKRIRSFSSPWAAVWQARKVKIS